jgi:AAA domain-containing protein
VVRGRPQRDSTPLFANVKASNMDVDPFSQKLPSPGLPSSQQWPAPIDYPIFETQPLEKPRPVIESLLDVSSRMIFGGGSKTFKTWAMSDMALSIATGFPFWLFTAFQANCLYVNFELKEFYMQRRLLAIRLAKKVLLKPGQLCVWNLRGYEVPLEMFKLELIRLIRKFGILVVFIDPFYKLLGGRDERMSAEINLIMATFDEINRLTGASIVFAAHFTKGNQAGKEAIDRISGGGSINRDPDNLVTLTKHETDQAFSVDFTLRDFAPIDPFVVRWEYPLLVRTDLDPEKIKRIGRPMLHDPDELFSIIKANDDELSTEQLVKKCKEELGWVRSTFFRKLDTLKKSKRIWLSVASEKWNVKTEKISNSLRI